MGRQIRFFQTEEDMLVFLDFMETLGVVIVGENTVASPTEMKGYVVTHMSSFPNQCVILPKTGRDKWMLSLNMLIGHAIGITFSLPTKGIVAQQKYEIGRLYYRKSDKEDADVEVSIVYEKLQRYIRKNYLYSKCVCAYVAPVFQGKYKSGIIFATQNSTPVIF